MKPGKKPTACSACHGRKVRCDASIIGVPCSRCVARQVGHECTLMKRARPMRNRGFIHHVITQRGSDITVENFNSNHHESPRHPSLQQETDSCQSSALPARSDAPMQPDIAEPCLTSPSATSRGSQSVAEEDAQLRMYTYLTGNPLIDSANASQDENHNTCELIEYRNELDHLSILCDAAAAQTRPKIVRVTVRESLIPQDLGETSNCDFTNQKSVPKEFGGYIEVDWNYLTAKSAFSLPSTEIRQEILKVYFKVVYPYAPVLDRIDFANRCLSENPQYLLVHAVTANVMPYVSIDMVKSLGFATRVAAMKAFDQRATLLYDIRSSKAHSQLELLQLSILLGALQYSLTADKDYRFWLHNAVRIATRMGLHRSDTSDEVNSEELALWRRIWWVIYIRDVQVTMSGLQNVPLIGPNGCQITELTLSDWPEEPIPTQLKECLQPVTRAEMLYQVEMCELARIGASVLHVLQGQPDDRRAPELLLQAVERVRLQRRQFPPELSLTGVSTEWSMDYLWASLLSGYSCRAECVVFSELARLQKSVNGHVDDALQHRQRGAMFEFDVIVGRNLMWNSVNYFPLGFVMIVATMLASHIHLAVKGTSSSAGANLSHLYIPQDFEFLKKSSETWDCVTWRTRLFEKILSHYARTGVEVGYTIPASKSQILPTDDPIHDPTGTFFTLSRMDTFAAHENPTMGMVTFDTDLDAWLGAMVRSEDLDQMFPDATLSNDFDWSL